MASSRYSTRSFRAGGGAGDDGYVPMNELLDPETLYTKQNQIGTSFLPPPFAFLLWILVNGALTGGCWIGGGSFGKVYKG